MLITTVRVGWRSSSGFRYFPWVTDTKTVISGSREVQFELSMEGIGKHAAAVPTLFQSDEEPGVSARPAATLPDERDATPLR